MLFWHSHIPDSSGGLISDKDQRTFVLFLIFFSFLFLVVMATSSASVSQTMFFYSLRLFLIAPSFTPRCASTASPQRDVFASKVFPEKPRQVKTWVGIKGSEAAPCETSCLRQSDEIRTHAASGGSSPMENESSRIFFFSFVRLIKAEWGLYRKNTPCTIPKETTEKTSWTPLRRQEVTNQNVRVKYSEVSPDTSSYRLFPSSDMLTDRRHHAECDSLVSARNISSLPSPPSLSDTCQYNVKPCIFFFQQIYFWDNTSNCWWMC